MQILPSLQLLDEIVLTKPPKKRFQDQGSCTKSRHMGGISRMIYHLSGGDTEGFKNYLLDQSKSFKPLVKKRIEGFIYVSIC
jgi:hypothetical protein